MYTLSAQTRDYIAKVELRDAEPHTIMKGGALRIDHKDGGCVALGRWSEARGIEDCPPCLDIYSEPKSQEIYGALETLLYDTATKAISATRVACHHGIDRDSARSVLFRLFDLSDVEAYEAVGLRPHCLASWTDPDVPALLAGASGWVFWWEECSASVSATAEWREYHENVTNMGEAMAHAAGHLRCQCGEVTGTQCDQFRRRSEMLVVEWMPYEHRASHEAAGNRGEYPGNGALRLLCAADCAVLLVQNEEGWAHPVGAES
jgi:hypothetical protein